MLALCGWLAFVGVQATLAAGAAMIAPPACFRCPAAAPAGPATGAVRHAVRERLLTEMLGGVQDTVGGGWKVGRRAAGCRAARRFVAAPFAGLPSPRPGPGAHTARLQRAERARALVSPQVLVLDEVTTRIMSSALKMSDITDSGAPAFAPPCPPPPLLELLRP